MASGRKINIIILCALFALMVLVRLTSPVDLFEGDQQKQVGYVMDLLNNGHWLTQYEVNGKIATKPPLYNWLAALVCILTGVTAPWAMKLPSLLAAMGLLALIYLLAQRLFDETTAFWAVLACMASHHFIKLAWFARTDMLMTFGLYAAIWASLFMKPGWGRAGVVGLLMGLNYLVKGPAGPVLFIVWLLVLTLSRRERLRPASFIRAVPGVIIFAAIAGAWLMAVWNKPQFQSVVIGQELSARIPGVAAKADAFYYYVPLIFQRIAPWTLVAIIALLVSLRRPERKNALLMASAALGMLVLLSLVPEKRHDLLLPVYPLVFILAGLGLRYFTEPVLNRRSGWILWPVSAGLIFFPAMIPFLLKENASVWVWIYAPVVSLCGLMAALQTARKSTVSIVWACAGIIVFHGLYFHGVANRRPVNLYASLRAFTAPVRDDARQGKALVLGQHPLISYELGLSRPDGDIAELAKEKPKWIITDPGLADKVRKITGWRLTEEKALTINDRFTKIDARLYAVKRDS